MRRVLAIFVMGVLLLGPGSEHLHDHDLGHAEGDCIACHHDRTPVEPPDLQPNLTPTPSALALAPLEGRSQLISQDPLRNAPKNSPPSHG